MEQSVQKKSNQLVTELSKVGIELKPKLTDVVELVVAEKIKEFHHNLTTLNKQADDLDKKAQELNKKNLKKALNTNEFGKKLADFPESNTMEYTTPMYNSGFKGVFISTISNKTDPQKIILSEGINVKRFLMASYGVVHITFKGFEGTLDCEIKPSKEIDKLYEDILNHNEQSLAFIREWNGLSFNHMKAAIKSQFQKKAVETLPTEVTKLLESTFNINL